MSLSLFADDAEADGVVATVWAAALAVHNINNETRCRFIAWTLWWNTAMRKVVVVLQDLHANR